MKAIASLLALALAACDPIAWGYVNRIPHRITVVKHLRDHDLITPLAPGGRIDPGFGRNQTFDLLDAKGVVFAHYSPSQLRVAEGRGLPYVVIRPNTVVVEPREKALAGLATHGGHE